MRGASHGTEAELKKQLEAELKKKQEAAKKDGLPQVGKPR